MMKRKSHRQKRVEAKQRRAAKRKELVIKPEHIGAGWYIVNGEKIRGKEAAYQKAGHTGE